MPKTRIPSPSRSLGTTTPRRHKHRGSRSVNSPAPSNASGRLTAIIDQCKEQEMDSFRMSPMRTRWSVLTDNTDIEEPRRKSWWKNLNENSQDLMMVLEDNKATDSNNSVEDLSDIEILSQENKNYSLDLPESSGSESIHSIVIPQRKLFTQKENKPQKKFGQIVGARETLTKLHKSNTTFHEKSIAAGTKELFQGTKRSKTVFSAALLNVSANKTAADKTTENITAESKIRSKTIFGNRPAKKRKNMFSDFILPDNEPEITEKQSSKVTVKKTQNANESKINTDKSNKGNSEQTVNQKMGDGNEFEEQIINEQAEDNMEFNQSEKEVRKIVDSRETIDKLQEPNNTHDEIVIANTKDLFQGLKNSKPVLSSTLLNMSVNKTVADKTNINITSEPIMPVKNIFGNRPDKKRKNIFADFVVSYSEHETSEIKTPIKGGTFNKTQSAIDKTKSKRANETNENKKFETEQNERMIVEDRVNQIGDDGIEVEDERIEVCQEVYPEATENFKSDQPQKKIRKVVDTREAIDKLHKANISQNDDIVTAGTKELFQGSKKSNTVFSSTLLHISPNKTIIDKAETNVLEPKTLVKNIFGNRSPGKRKNIFADFLESESEHELSEIRAQEKDDSIAATAPQINKDQENEAHGMNKIDIEQSVKGKQHEVNISGEEVQQDKMEAKKSIGDERMRARQRSGFLEKTSFRLYQEDEYEHEAIVNVPEQIEYLEKDCNGGIEEEICEQSNGDNEEVTPIESESDEEMNYEESDEEVHEAERHHEEECIKDKEDEEIYKQNGEDNQENITNENEDYKEEDGHETENDEEINYEESDEEGEANESQEDVCIDNEESEEINENQKIINEDDEFKENGDIDNKEEAKNVEDDNEMNENLEVYKVNEDQEVNDIEAENEEKHDKDMNKSLEVHDEVNEFNEDIEIDNNEEQEEEINELNKSEEEKSIEDENDDLNETDVQANELSEEVEGNESESDEEMNYEESEEEIPEVNRTEEEESVDNEKDEEIIENQHDEVNESNVEELDNDSDVEEMKYEESEEEEIQENVKTHEDKCNDNKENEQTKQNQEVRNKFNDLKEVTAPVDSSAEGSGWDSHRVTRKTLRQTFGKEFTPRKSLRALVMEKSAKQTAKVQTLHSETTMLPQANSTEFPEHSNAEDNLTVESDHELSRRTRQTTLETYLQKMKQQNMEKRLKMNQPIKYSLQAPQTQDTLNLFKVPLHAAPRKLKPTSNLLTLRENTTLKQRLSIGIYTGLQNQAIRNSLQAPKTRDNLNLFKVPLKPAPRKLKSTSNKPKKQLKSILFGELPSEVIEDMKYKPPKRFQPSNASWITKRLYKFLEQKLEPKYDYKARVRAEKLVETIYHFAKDLRRHNVAPIDSVDVLKHELARLGIVKTHFEFYNFFHEFMPREIRVKVVPDVVNKIPLPRHGVFADILKANAVQG